jgi:hypothetical protein
MSSLTNIAFFRARVGQTQAFGSALRALVDPTRAEAECLNYDLHQSIDDGDVWFAWVANTSLLWAPDFPLGLTVLAIAQMEIHLMFFLHITTGPDNTDNVLALAFGILIVLLVVPVRCLSWRI